MKQVLALLLFSVAFSGMLRTSPAPTTEDKLKEFFSDHHTLYKQCKAYFTPLEPKRDKPVPENDEIFKDGIKIVLPKEKPYKHRYEDSKMGLEDSSYFFDYLDNTVLDTIFFEFNDTWDNMKKLKDSTYAHSFGVFKISKDKDGNEINVPLEEDLAAKKIMEVRHGFSEKAYKNSITAENLSKAIHDYSWSNMTDTPDSLVNRYDYDGDGRLNPREFFYMLVELNFDICGVAKMFFNKTCTYFINTVFYSIDCERREFITAKGLFNQLKHLQAIKIDKIQSNSNNMALNDATGFIGEDMYSHKGEPKQHDFYLCKYKTETKKELDFYLPVNDFFLKAFPSSHKEIGRMSMGRFSEAILVGYINRVVFSWGISRDYYKPVQEELWKQIKGFC